MSNLESERYTGLRDLPYPYKAMLAICSDLDETKNWGVYREIMTYLNTTETVSTGPGLGLEVGNTLYFDMPKDQFSYGNADETARNGVIKLIDSGHIDCLHSYGDFAITRAHAEKALGELKKAKKRIEIWVDHAVAPTNFGADVMQGQGDIPGANAFHADITCEYGVKYVWRGRVTSVIGQNTTPSLRGLWNAAHPLVSGKTVLKEWAKRMMARLGNKKYAMHSSNDLLRNIQLRSGQKVIEFLRMNPFWGGVDRSETGEGLGAVLTEKMLQRLVEVRGSSILYTHLGKVSSPDKPFDKETVDGLGRLKAFSERGDILVTTTRRLLGYCTAKQEIAVERRNEGEIEIIEIKTELPESDLDGLTFFVANPDKTRLEINGLESERLNKHPASSTQPPCISISWSKLVFPDFA